MYKFCMWEMKGKSSPSIRVLLLIEGEFLEGSLEERPFL